MPRPCLSLSVTASAASPAAPRGPEQPAARRVRAAIGGGPSPRAVASARVRSSGEAGSSGMKATDTVELDFPIGQLPRALASVDTADARLGSTLNGAAAGAAESGKTRAMTSKMIAKAKGITEEALQAVGTKLQRCAYQGVPGAYSEQAALRACPGCEPLPCEQFETAFQALSQWMAERATLPIENSLGGSIHTVYDLLLRYNLHIVGEVMVPVNHALMALPGTRIEDLNRVMSHPQALAQCDGYLRKLPVVREAVDDTAGAAQAIKEGNLEGVAAVASERAADIYGMDILDTRIQDFKQNITRFLVLSRDPLVIKPESDRSDFKTSIVFSLGEGPGQLFKALSVFALRDIDMTKIESRPMRTKPFVVPEDVGGARFNYLFYIDFVGTLADADCQNALRHLQEIAPFMRVLGSYPMDTTVDTPVYPPSWTASEDSD